MKVEKANDVRQLVNGALYTPLVISEYQMSNVKQIN